MSPAGDNAGGVAAGTSVLKIQFVCRFSVKEYTTEARGQVTYRLLRPSNAINGVPPPSSWMLLVREGGGNSMKAWTTCEVALAPMLSIAIAFRSQTPSVRLLIEREY